MGSVLGLRARVFGTSSVRAGLPLPPARRRCVGAGPCGLANGWLSSRWQLPSFIVTLAMLEIARGATYLVTESQTLYLGARVDAITADVVGGLGAPVFLAVAVVAAVNVALTHTVFGRHIFAVGVNDEAARLAGIDPRPRAHGGLHASAARWRERPRSRRPAVWRQPIPMPAWASSSRRSPPSSLAARAWPADAGR